MELILKYKIILTIADTKSIQQFKVSENSKIKLN